MSRSRLFTLVCLALLFESGCAGLQFKSETVSFDSPAKILQLKEVEPNAEELNGVTLRFLVPESRELHAKERLKVYSRLKDNQGMALDLDQNVLMTFRPVEGKDSYVQRTVATFENGGEILEEIETSPRGEILKLIEGKHDSPAGKFNMISETRTPMVPQEAVKIGDRWTYDSSMDVRLESFWIKEQNPTPYQVKAESELTGFAEALGHRCAVIKTVSKETKNEVVKVLFKTIDATIETEIIETAYLDYKHGWIVGKVTESKSHTVFQNLKIEDHGISQSIFYVTET